MNRNPDQSRDRAAGGSVPARRPSFVKLFFDTSIFEILAYGTRGKGGLLAQVDGLPPAGRDLILRVVRRARLWKVERIDVAAELASHFREGLEKGASADELVRGFGDERTTARLIRRGMRRKRPLAWKLWFYWSRGLVSMLLVTIAAYVFLYGRAMIDAPSIKRNYVAEWNAVTLAIPEADRGAPLYSKANHAIASTPGVKDGVRFMVERDPSERGYAVSKAFLEANPQLVPLIIEATRRPRMGMVISDADPSPEWNMVENDGNITPHPKPASHNPALIGVLLPHLGPMRQMARIVTQDAAIAIEARDTARVLEDWAAIPRMARHASEDATLIGQLVGVAMLDMMFRDVADVMQSKPDLFSAAQLRDLAHVIAGASLHERPGDFKVGFVREKDMFDDFIQRCFTDDGRGDGRLAPRGLAELGASFLPEWVTVAPQLGAFQPGGRAVGPAAPIAVIWSAGRRQTVDAYRESLAAYEEERAIPLWHREAPRPLAAAMSKYGVGYGQSRYFVSAMMYPSFSRIVAVEREIAQMRDVAMVSVALVAYRASRGDWPSTLGELVPTYLPGVPLDGFDGKPLKYRLVDKAPLLYSIGSDFEDNQGKAAPTEGAARDVERMDPGLVTSKGAAKCDAVYWPRPVYPKPAPSLE